jgi:hypothetical protein
MDHAGKKVVVVGSCTSGMIFHPYLARDAKKDYQAHDIASDYYNHGIGPDNIYFRRCTEPDEYSTADVTMYQRSPTYVMTVKEGARFLYGGLSLS